MNAIESAPPEMSANRRSGRLLATLNASSSNESENWRAMMIERAKASTLSMPKKRPMIRDVRARKESLFIDVDQVSRDLDHEAGYSGISTSSMPDLVEGC